MFKVLLRKQLAEIFKGYFYDAKRNKMRSKLAIAGWVVFFVVIIFGVLGGMFLALSLSLCGGLVSADAGWLYFVIMVGMSILMGTFGAVFNSFAMLYMAKDNDLLLSLPIPVKDLFASRLVSVYLLGVLYSFIVMVPALIVYWATVGPDAVTVICGIVLLLIVSIIVLCLSCLLGWVVAKISLKIKNKSLLTVAITVAFIVLYYAVYFQASDAIRDLLLNAAFYGAEVKGAAYGLFLFGSIGEGNVLATALFAGIAAVVLVLTLTVMSRSYLSIVTATSKTKHVRYVEKAIGQKSKFGALFGKELALFLSSPNYMLNTGLGILFMVAVGVAVLLNAQILNELVTEVFGGSTGEVCVLFCGALCMMAASNDIAAPSVSLEGKSIWILQSLPVVPKIVLRAKTALHFVMTAIPLAFAVACCAVALDVPTMPKALMCLAPFACVTFTAAFASFLGVRMANIAWTNEIVPIKQGGAVTIALFGGWGIVVVFIALYFVLGAGVDPTAYLAAWTVLFLVAALVLLRWLDTKGSQLFAEL